MLSASASVKTAKRKFPEKELDMYTSSNQNDRSELPRVMKIQEESGRLLPRKKENFIKSTVLDDDHGTVYISAFTEDMPPTLELQIPCRITDLEDHSQLFLSHLENEEVKNSVVTIQVPPLEVENNEAANESEGDDNDNILHSMELNLSETLAMTDLDGENPLLITLDDNSYFMKPVKEEIIISEKPTRIPVWKRETPRPPGKAATLMNLESIRSILRPGRSKVIIDQSTSISVAEFKSQLADTSDIRSSLELAPSSKKRAKELTSNSVAKLFAYPGRPIPSKVLYLLYQRHLTSQMQKHEPLPDIDLKPIGYTSSITSKSLLKYTTKNRNQISKENCKKLNEMTVKSIGSFENNTNSLSPDQTTHVFIKSNIEEQMERPIIKTHIDTYKLKVETRTNIDEQKAILSQTDIDVQQIMESQANNDQPEIIVSQANVEEQQIIVTQDGEETSEGTASLQHSIEVLLAAAESGDLSKELNPMEQVYICTDSAYDDNATFLTAEQIIIVQSELDEDDLCNVTLN